MAEAINRRQAICIIAATAGLPLLRSASEVQASAKAVVWKGQALGAPATLILNHSDRAKADRIIEQVVVEVSQLESVFSLYRSNSALCELNRTGALAAPPSDMVSLLQKCRTFFELSGGTFDPTIQPLWMLYGRHFSTIGADPAGPTPASVKQAIVHIGFDGVRFNRDRVAFARPGMALTLNGIAQGYITDRIVDLLRNAGVTSSLVDMGENRAIGTQADGSPWRIGLAAPEYPDKSDSVLTIVNRAVATSSAAGFHFDDAARFGHILDPRSGAAPQRYRRMTVVASDATTGDALSTAFSLMDPTEIGELLKQQAGVMADFVSNSGDRARIGSSL